MTAVMPPSTRTTSVTTASSHPSSPRPGACAVVDEPGLIRRCGTRFDRAIGIFLEASTAALVVAEIVILFVGILARYVFHRPLVWSDELASILFLWLAVLGSALAFRRAENLRMTTLVNKLPAAA